MTYYTAKGARGTLLAANGEPVIFFWEKNQYGREGIRHRHIEMSESGESQT